MSIRGKGWDDLSESDRDRFLLAAVGGMEEWQSVMRDIGLDANAATKVATSISPIMAAPRFEEERRERERAALSFHGSRPMGQALRAALLRRDLPIAGAAADIDHDAELPSMLSAPDGMDRPRSLRRSSTGLAGLLERPQWPTNRLGPAAARAAEVLTLVTTAVSQRLRLFRRAVEFKASGMWKRAGQADRPRHLVRNRSPLADLWHRAMRLADRLRPAMRDSIKVLSEAVAPVADRATAAPPRPKPDRGGHQTEERQVFDGGWTGDDGSFRDDLNVLEAALARWRGMGPVLKDMTVASALRGYSPALAFVRLIAPHVRPAATPAPSEDIAEWDAEEIRHRRMLRALERERALMFRLLRHLFPPIG